MTVEDTSIDAPEGGVLALRFTDDGTLAPPAEPEVDWFTQRLNDLLFDLMSTRLFVLFELIFRQVA